MPLPFPLKAVTVVCGHYGVGKTNFALNIAVDASLDGYETTLIDLDIVNPYFRSSEYRCLLEEHGIELVAPVFAAAGSNLDVPSLTGAIIPAINRAYHDERQGSAKRKLIVDVGGDDAGATALARFSHDISAGSYDLLYVVNRFRNLTQRPQEALSVLREIELRSGLTATGIVSNAHMKSETGWGHIHEGESFAIEVAQLIGLDVVCTTRPIWLHPQEMKQLKASFADEKRYPVRMLVRSPWE
ncbi:MAG: ParA family protein [Eggerthellaceae bacterium]|nr:ParA family protein [Eggerthellaceae bacterium]